MNFEENVAGVCFRGDAVFDRYEHAYALHVTLIRYVRSRHS